MKIIDFHKKGNVVRFFLGADDDFNYSGDDWDDVPYEHNAGRVYSDHIIGHKDVFFPFDDLVLEPCDGDFNSFHTKEDMKKRIVPCIIVIPKEIHDEEWDDSFSKFVGADGIQKYYFGDQMEPDENT